MEAAEAGMDAGVYEHLSKIVERVVTERPTDALGVVEIMSRLVKEAAGEKRPVGPKAPPPTKEEDLKRWADYSDKVLVLDQDFMERDGDGVPTGPKQCCAIPDYMVEADMFAWAGVGFGDLESYKAKCSMRNLATREEGYKSMRLWGKMLGTQQDYYIVEAERDAQPDWEPAFEGEEPPDPKAVMYSWYAYFVTTDLCASWTKLPELRPKELTVAREIKKLFTGRLDAPVITHPYFDGTEANLLRSQIALITADTTLCIKGIYTFPGEEEPPHLTRPTPDTKNVEFVWPAPSDLLHRSAWVHMQPHIMESGLTFNEEPAEEAPEKDDVEAYTKYLVAKAVQGSDPKRDLMRGLEGDKLQWTIKQAGDTAMYNAPYGTTGEKPQRPRSNAVTYVRSVSWPGAVCVHRGRSFANLYVGYGVPAGAPDFYFRAPLDIQDEPDDAEEEAEPQGTEEVKVADDADA